MASNDSNASWIVAGALLCMLVLSAIPAQAKETAPAALEEAHRLSLAALGYPAGVYFDDNTLPQRYEVLFHLPKKMALRGATLHLVYRAMPPQSAGTTLAITVNDRVIEPLIVNGDGKVHEWSVPLMDDELQGGQLKLEMERHVASSATICKNGKLDSGRLRVMPATYLESYTQRPATTLRDYWLTLPQKVRISLPEGTLDEGVLAAGVEWVTLLRRYQRDVSIVRLPEVGDVVLMPQAEPAVLEMARPELRQAAAELRGGASDIFLVTAANRSYAVVKADYGIAENFNNEWRLLERQGVLRKNIARNSETEQKVAVKALDIDTQPAQIQRRLEWFGTITPWKLPPGTRPEALQLVVRKPQLDNGERLRLYVYINEKLVLSRFLLNDGGKESVSVPFGEHRRDNVYRLRIVLRRGLGTECDAAASREPFAIDEASYLAVERGTSTVTQFDELPQALGHGLELYLPDKSRNAPEQYLLTVGEMLAGMVVNPFDYQLRLYSASKEIKPTRNFVVISTTDAQGLAVPMRMDRGRVDVVDRRGRVLLAHAELRKQMVLQIARYGNVGGVWLHINENQVLPTIDIGLLGSGDVAILNSRERVLSVDTHQYGITHFRYLDDPHWFEGFYKNRWLWLTSAWGILTLIMLYLYWKAKQHRRS